MSTAKIRLKACVLSLHTHYVGVKGYAKKTIEDGAIHDSFFNKYITEIKVNEEVNRLLGWDKEYVESDEYKEMSEDIVLKTINNLVNRLKKRHAEILFFAPSENNFIEMYALQRCLYWLNEVLTEE